MKFDKQTQLSIGQEYFKRKIFRKMAEWFRSWITQYPYEEIKEKIIKNEFIIEDLEKELIKTYPKGKVLPYLKEIEMYKNSITPQDKQTLHKMIFFQLPEYRHELQQNSVWLNEQIKKALIAFDSYIFKIKQGVDKSEP